MAEQPEALISLGQAWEYPSPYAEQLMAAVERRFAVAAIAVYGHGPAGDRQLIRFPADYEIDWIGSPSTGAAEHEPCARRRTATGAVRRQLREPSFTALMIRTEDWSRLSAEILPLELREPDPQERIVAMPRRTGLAGKPTSWHLVEAECRRRFALGERHPGEFGESRAAWAAVLGEWLRAVHPDAPRPTPKTLTNRLGDLLRELRAMHPDG